MDQTDFESNLHRMLEWQIERRGVHDRLVLDAFRKVPRHLFVPNYLQEDAYQDTPLPIGNGQTISQPYIVALMTELLQLTGSEKVLEIGTGSGYQAAILAEICLKVVSIEYHAALAEQARQVLSQIGLNNVNIINADGGDGYPPEAPYDAIIITAQTNHVPAPLFDQLASGGRLVAPIGDSDRQVLQVWRKDGSGTLTMKENISVQFVPLLGKWA